MISDESFYTNDDFLLQNAFFFYEVLYKHDDFLMIYALELAAVAIATERRENERPWKGMHMCRVPMQNVEFHLKFGMEFHSLRMRKGCS